MNDKPLNKNEQIKQTKDGYDVLADLYRYSEVGDYDAIEKDDLESRFRWYGVYRQKPNTGHFMLRVRVPGGQLTPAQLRLIAQLNQRYARGFADITTRQTIQFHWVTIADLKPIFTALAKENLLTLFACGDTPRNVVGCPLAGVIQDEIVDAAPQIEAVNRYYVQAGRELSNLPRKYKTAIAGCPIHCHQPQINDLAFYGVRRPDGSTGYGLLVGGGLSDTPHFAQPMRAFVKPEQVVDVARAVAHLFRDHGYREKRNRARLKFLVADKGWQWIRDMIEQNLGYALEHDDSLLQPPAVHGDHMGIGQQKDGAYYVGIPIERGRWTARQMETLADLSDRFAQGPRRIRTTNKQNVILLDVPKQNLDALCKALTDAGLPPQAHPLRGSLVSCTGSEFCNLAVIETKHRAGAILRWLEENTQLDVPLFISVTGCPNACAQYQIADIGLTGIPAMDPVRQDEHGKPLKVDGFKVLLGGCLGSNPQFGQVIAKKIPADRIHLALKNLIERYLAERFDADEPFAVWCQRNEPERLQQLIHEPVESPQAQPLSV